MKTKNIFRMLLVAAALLMGANNVKAGVDGQIWPDNGADNNTAQCSIGGQKFKDANITAGQYLRVYLGNIFGDGGYWQMGFKADNADPEFDAFPGQNWGVETISSQMGVSISSGYIDLKCSANTVTKLKQGGFTIDATGIIIKNVAIVDGSSSGGGNSTTDTPVWSSETGHYLGNWGGDGGSALYLPAGTFSTLKCDGTDVIRVYGRLGNLAPTGNTTYGIEFVTLDWHNYLKYHGTDNFSNGYVDIPISADRLSCTEGTLLSPVEFASYLKNTNNNNNCAVVNGYNFYVTSIVINPTNAAQQKPYSVSVNAGSNGSATVDMTSAAEGDIVTITATPSNGYEVGTVSVTYDNGSVNPDNYGNNVYKFEMPAANVTVTVTFNEIQTQPSGELYDISRSFGNYEYRTYVTPYVIDFSRSVGVEGYYAKEVSGNNVVFYQITGTCADGVPLLLKKTDSTPKLWKLTGENASGTTPEPNLLIAGPATASGNNIYVLTYHNGNYVFAETEFQSANVGSERAYLNLNSNNARAYSIKFVKGNTNGISNVEAETFGDGAFYNLRGQRVEHPTKGLYIINGRKVIIK